MITQPILLIAFFHPERKWIYSILNELNPAQKEKYFKSPLPLLHNSLGIKRTFIFRLINNVIGELQRVNKTLNEDEDAVLDAIDNKWAYGYKNKAQLYSIIGQIEAILVGMKSVTELILKYIQEFNKQVLNDNKKKTEVIEEIESNGIDLSWRLILTNLRNDFIHHYSAWISFKKLNGKFDFNISLPENLGKDFRKQYRKTHDITLDSQAILEFYQKIDKFFLSSIQFLINKLTNQRPAS